MTTSTKQGAASAQPLFVSIAEAARLLSVSERLMYELTDSGEIPAVRVGRRRKVIPRLAIDQLVERAMDGFDAARALARLSAADGYPGAAVSKHGR